MGMPKGYNYRPLPEKFQMKVSDIEGHGVFTQQFISKGYIEYEVPTHIELDDNTLVRTSLGGWLNHSDTPNCTLIMEYQNYPKYYIKLLKDIQLGHEITLNYNDELCGCGEDKLKQ